MTVTRHAFAYPLLVLLFLAGLIAPTPGQAAPGLALQEADTTRNLALDMQALDATNRPFQGVEQALAAGGWAPVQQQTGLLESPRQHSTLWLKGRVNNASDRPIQRWLEVAPWRLNTIDAWLLNPSTNRIMDHLQIELNGNVSERRIHSTRPIIPVSLSPGESARVLLRIESDSRPYLTITNWSPAAFSAEKDQRYQFHSILFAVILTLFAVLLLQGNLRYALLGVWMLALFVFETEKEGYISYLFFEGLSEYAANLRFSSSILVKALFLTTSVYLLRLNRHRYWRWLAPLTITLTAVYSGLTFVLGDNEARSLAVILHSSFAVLWLVTLPSALRLHQPWQRPIIALLGLLWATDTTFILIYTLNIDYTSELADTRIIFQAGVILGLLMLYALQKQDEKRSLENQLRQREKAEKAELERAVQERTGELNLALEAARKANAAKTDFLSRITHDLKSPLTSILGYSQMLQAEPGRIGQMSQIIVNSTHHMLSMVNRLIDYARNVTTVQVHTRDVYTHAFMGNIRHEANILAEQGGNRFHYRQAADLCPVIHCDDTLLRQILINLINNACKHTDQGDVTLDVACAQSPETGGWQLVCSVKDTGIGIAPERQHRLFDPFYRLSDKTEGSGLGLPIVQDLVNKLNGAISVTSEPGAGTRIEVILPIDIGTEAADSALLNLPSDWLPRFNAHGSTAWVVEDAPEISDLLTLELEKPGFGVRVFANAEDAIRALETTDQDPDLIITDHRLPGACGDDVLRAAKRRNPDIPVILLSATWDLRSSVAPSDSTGDYTARLGKPIDQARLYREIAHACQLPVEAASEPGPAPPQTEPRHDAFSTETLALLEQWVKLGAVTDLTEWCDDLERQSPDQADFAQRIRQLAERGRFGAISEELSRVS